MNCKICQNTHTHTYTQPFNGPLSGTIRVGWYQKEHSPTHAHPHEPRTCLSAYRSTTQQLIMSHRCRRQVINLEYIFICFSVSFYKAAGNNVSLMSVTS